MSTRLRYLAFDPDEGAYDKDDDARAPFANSCECGQFKHADNRLCDDCAARASEEDHA